MCYNLAYVERKQQKLQERYEKVKPIDRSQTQLNLPVFYFVSGFDHPQLPIVRSRGIELFEWGLIPWWVKDTKAALAIQLKTLNAVGETVFEKPSFKDSIWKQRCLVAVNGFYEWRDFKKVKYPYLIKTKSTEIFSLGGIYNTWVDKTSGEIHSTFSIITTPANPMMEQIHNIKKRMPLIIHPADEPRWINPDLPREEVEQLIKPYDENDMTAYTVSREANNARNNRNIPDIMQEVSYPELNGESKMQATLF